MDPRPHPVPLFPYSPIQLTAPFPQAAYSHYCGKGKWISQGTQIHNATPGGTRDPLASLGAANGSFDNLHGQRVQLDRTGCAHSRDCSSRLEFKLGIPLFCIHLFSAFGHKRAVPPRYITCSPACPPRNVMQKNHTAAH